MSITATRIALAGAALGTVLALTATSASAAIVCNDEGDCWRVKHRYEYKPEFRLHVHPDDWKWGDHDKHKYRWRESRGRGYWREGLWIQF
ncbi:hypothetical protein [uncultured Hyphomicrobium sp.]|uniref:hypothetical protein n=1 Tax=uncultured Hyphomicrobium sp. TaxID=194373 RepID=UPI0025D0A4C0|nr:hypothetical protein [uncultured Hyphomicrobium sp.]